MNSTAAFAQADFAESVNIATNEPEAAILEQIRSYTNTLTNTTEVSVVTAYFDLGPLNKKYAVDWYTPDLYKRWMSTFRWLDNPLVVFADTEDTVAYFRQIRTHYPPSRTTIIHLQRHELWAFQLESEIQKIYTQSGYPLHQPNTVYAAYSCVMHAKFELMQKVLLEQLYQTQYVAWLDVRLFRSEVNKNKTIHLTVPTDFRRTHVGYSQVNEFAQMTPDSIIRWNMVWVGGASFLATPEVMFVYCSDYRRAVRKLLDMNWMSTDQQTYTRHPDDSWFSMGYLMKEAP